MMVRKLTIYMGLALLLLWPATVVMGRQESDDSAKRDKPAAEKPADKQDQSTEQESDDEDSKKEPDAGDLMRKAIATARDGNMDGAIELIEQANKLEPQDARIAMTLIGALQSRAMELVENDKRDEANPYFFKAANFVRGLERDLAEMIGPRAGMVIYNEACAFALSGDAEKALASLDEAFERGHDDIDLTRSDADLASLRDNEKFVALIEKHEKRIVEKLIAETKDELKNFETYDFNFNLKNLDGEEIKLEDYKGKLVIVDFWGTWCPPCRAEIPHFIKLKETYADQGLEVIGVTYENADDEEAAIKGVKEFVAENKMNYPCVIGDDATQEMVPDFQGYPTTLFIDREGIVRLQLVGAQPHAKLESVVKELMETK